jgi:hypothetical protein
VTVRGATDADPDFGELSLLASGQWGRFEIGERRGLPDVLTGYAPNSYQFVSAEFGPASGPSLDPDGGLQTALLPGSIAAGINALSGLGITAALFFDESLKAIYVSPRRRGFQGGISLAPNAYASTGDRDQLLQNGLVYEHYWQQNVLRVGGTYTFADGARADGTGAGTEALHSGSAGASLTLNDKLTLGASFTFNGDSGLTRNGDFRSGAYGYAFSINYNDGPWTFGGFLQAAHAEGSTFQAGDDTLRALEFGASYRASTRVRGYAAVYAYDFEDEGQAGADGAVFIVGLRLSL